MTGRLALLVLPLLISGCTKLFFYPYTQYAGVPSDLGYQYDDIWLTSVDGTRVHAWHIQPEVDSKGLIYFLHGNAENISTHIRSVLWMVVQGYDVLALDYRGYGQSDGKPDIPEVFEDIQAGVKWLELSVRQNDRPVFLFAQSLGASLAIKYLDLYPQSGNLFDALVVEAAFTRYGEIARHVASGSWITWLFQYPVDWLLPDQYDPIDAIERLVPLPVLIVHSVEDEIIPYEHGLRLYDKAGESSEFLRARGPHIQSIRDPETRVKILEFIEQYQ